LADRFTGAAKLFLKFFFDILAFLVLLFTFKKSLLLPKKDGFNSAASSPKAL
jgi:hypothetical protein